jgi:hypothetical protein
LCCSKEIDEKVAELKLKAMGVKIDVLRLNRKSTCPLGKWGLLKQHLLGRMTNFKLIELLHGYKVVN